jgi:hypothetical protein
MVDLGYSSWPFGRQLKLTQVFFSILVSLGLILSTRYQLIWLSDKIASEYTSLLQSKVLSQMQETAFCQKRYIEEEFKTFIKFVENLERLDSLILGFSSSPSIIESSRPVQHTEYGSSDYDLKTGSFMSSHQPLSAAGSEIETKHAGMDKIYPLIHRPQYLFIYSGFETDEIIHFYPGGFIGSYTYTPLVREWYYKAKDQEGHVIITEPYIDISTSSAVVTVSKAIFDENKRFFGVTACDITLSNLQQKVYSIRILNNGFMILVSIGGVMLTAPKPWNLTLTSNLIVYNSNLTGINEGLWNKILGSEDGKKFEFTRKGVSYTLIKYEIHPFQDNEKATHFLLACAEINEIIEPVFCIQDHFQEAFILIFLLVVTIAVFLFFSISIILHFFSSRLSFKLRSIKNIFTKISHRALIPDVTRGIVFDDINKNRRGIESLVDATKMKICQVREKEEIFKYFPWKVTRPNDDFFYYKWFCKLYPFNYFNAKVMSWRKSLSLIINENLN